MKLTLEDFGEDITGEWTYLFLEFAVIEPTNSDAEGTLMIEDVRGRFPGEYVASGGSESHISERLVARILGGNMVVVSKSSMYNLNSGTYDGRQGARSQAEFRQYIERVILLLASWRILPDQFGNVDRLDESS